MILQHRKMLSSSTRSVISWCILAAILSCPATSADAATAFDGDGGNAWWFNFENWGAGLGTDGTTAAPNFLPPAQEAGGVPTATDAQINVGSFNTAEGVVYDPVNDPYFNNATYMSQFSFPTGSPATAFVGDYGPQNLYRFYLGRNVNAAANPSLLNLMTIKSGNLTIADTTIVGRSGEVGNLGKVVQTGGNVRLPLTNLDISNREASGWGNGVWDYQGGTLLVADSGGTGIRLSSGGGAGAGGKGTFVMRNPGNAAGGYVRTFDFVVASHAGTNDGIQNNLDPDGIDRGVGVVQFRYGNGGTRPIQVMNNLVINNGESDAEAEDGESRWRSARLELALDQAPTVDGGGVPISLGLFDTDFDMDLIGNVTGTGTIDGNSTANEDTDQVFSNSDASAIYSEGSIVSAMLGGSTYRWTISYTGNITWTDPDASIVNTITGAGTGTDVVLIGLDSMVAEGLDGDFDDNGMVDASDYTVWRDNLGGNSAVLNGNGSGAATVVQADYELWKSQFGMSGSGSGGLAASAVPEPASAVLMLMTVLGIAGVRRRNA
jgi:hypothetical protein